MSASNPWDFSNILLANQGGQAIGQGLASIGQSAGQAIRQYGENKMMASKSIGAFEGAAQANPDLIAHLSQETTNPEIKKIFGKLQKDGSVGFKDAAALSAYANSFVSTKQQQQLAQLQAAQVEAAKAAGLANTQQAGLYNQQAEAERLKNALFQRVTQPMGGGGGGNLSAYANPPQAGGNNLSPYLQTNAQMGMPSGNAPTPAPAPTPVSAAPMPVENPFGFDPDPQTDAKIFQQQIINTAGRLPAPAEMNDRANKRQEWLNTPQDIGFHDAGFTYDDSGNAVIRQLIPVSKKPGDPKRVIFGKDVLKVDPNQTPTVPLVDAMGNPVKVSPMAQAPYNPNATKAQEELGNAYGAVRSNSDAVTRAQFLKDAVDAYAADPTSGNRLNALLGGDTGSKFKQMFTGTNPAAQVKAAGGQMYASMIDALRNEKTGANALRTITQQELTQLQTQYGQTEMPPYLQKALAANTVAVAERHLAMNSMYADLRSKGIRPTDAEAAVLKDPRFSTPFKQTAIAPSKIDPAYIKILRENVAALSSPNSRQAQEVLAKSGLQNPYEALQQIKQQFDTRYGAGSSDYILSTK